MLVTPDSSSSVLRIVINFLFDISTIYYTFVLYKAFDDLNDC